MAFMYLLSVLTLVVTCTHAQILVRFLADEEMSGNQLLGNIVNQVTTLNLSGWEFTINSNDYSDFFSIEGNSDVYLIKKVDREQLCSSQMECKIRIQIWAILSSSQQVIDVDVIIVDHNDNTPTFSRSVLNMDIPEGTAMGTSYELPSAVDDDIGNNTIQTYVLRPPTTKFGLDTFLNPDGTTSLNLVLNLTLDREIEQRYELFILAIDGGSEPLTGQLTVNINVTDINDNRPVFNPQKYNTTINEDIAPGTEIVTVTATDRDIGENARLEYVITKMEPASIVGLIGIESTTGKISLMSTLSAVTGPFTLYVEAKDHGFPVKRSYQAEVKIYIRDINNNSPEISVNTLNDGKPNAKALENANIGTLVALINVKDADTGDNHETECTCENTNFSIQVGSVNTFSVHVAADFDREVLDIYTLLINCTDKGDPPLWSTATFDVTIEDENDNKPKFSKPQYTKNITEGNNAGAVILRVSASDLDIDKNARLAYSIEPFSDQGMFSIDSDGVIKALGVFDREFKDFYTFSVLVKDNGDKPLNDTAVVTIRILDLNDNEPAFNGDSYAMSVLENSNISKSIGQVTATDNDLGDNGRVSYTIPQEFSSYPFAVLDDGTVVTTEVLDREAVNLYQFDIIAADHGAQPLSTRVPVHVTVLDINDNPPSIEFPYGENDTVSLASNTPPNTVIATIIADDVDETENKRLSYSIIAGNDEQLFMINVITGDISLTSQISDVDIKQFTLTISVKDNGANQLETRGTLHVSIFTATATGGSEVSTSGGQNILIAIVIGCVTFVLSLLIIVIICVIKRKDRQKKLYSAKAYDEQKIIQAEGYRNSNRSNSSKGSQDKMLYPNEALYMENGYAKKTRNKVSFSVDEDQDTGVSMETSTEQFDPVSTFKSPSPVPSQPKDYENYQQEVSPPRSERSDDTKHREINRMTSLRVHQALIQSNNNNNNKQWPQSPQEEPLGRGYSGLTRKMHLDDTHSESSGETTTSDSGRGGSEEDIRSNMTISHDTDESRSPNTSSSHPFYASDNQQPSFTSFHGNGAHKTGPILSSFLKKKQNRQNTDDKHNHNLHYQMNDLSNPHKNNLYSNTNYNPYRAHSDAGVSPRNSDGSLNVDPQYSAMSVLSFGKVNNNLSDHLIHSSNQPHLNHGNSYEESVAGLSQDDDNTTTTSGSFTLPDLHDEMLASDAKDMFYKPDTFV